MSDSISIEAKGRDLLHLIDVADSTGGGDAVTTIWHERRLYRVHVTSLTEADKALEAINEAHTGPA